MKIINKTINYDKKETLNYLIAYRDIVTTKVQFDLKIAIDNIEPFNEHLKNLIEQYQCNEVD